MPNLIQEDTVNVSVSETNTNVSVGIVGIQGPPGGGGVGSVFGFITTGDADGRYYPLDSNPSGYLTSFNAGSVISINSISGNVFLTGLGSISVTTSGQYLQISGLQVSNSVSVSGLVSSGDLESTGTALQNQINGISIPSIVGLIQTGDVNLISGSLQENIEFSGGYLFGLISASSAGVSSINSQSGIITINGSDGISVETDGSTITISGIDLVDSGNLGNSLNGLSTSGDLESTGTALQAQIDAISVPSVAGLTTSGELESTGTALQDQIDGLSIPSVAGLATSGDLETTGTSLQNQIDSLNIPSVDGLTTSGDLESTGTAIVGLLDNYYETSNPDNYSSSGNVENTGTALQNQIDALSIPSVVGLTTSGDLESTGTALQDQIDALGGSDTSGLATSGYVDSVSGSLQEHIEFSGGYLFGLISASSAGVSSINSQSGVITLNGSDGISIETNGSTITVSGIGLVNSGDLGDSLNGLSTSGDLENTGTALQDQINSIPSYDLNGLTTSGELESTGTALQDQLSNYYLNTNPDSFSSSGNVESTGTSLQDQINALSIPSVVGLTTSGELESTGTALQDQIDALSIPSVDGLASSGDFISGVSISGGVAIQGALNIDAGANVTLTQNGANSFSIAAAVGGGDTSGLATSGYVDSASGSLQENIEYSGAYLNNLISGRIDQTGIRTVRNIDELRGFPYNLLNDGDAILVQSYYNDGTQKDRSAGGIFIWDVDSSSTDDSGRFVNPSGNAGNGRYERQIIGVPDVSLWGARGNFTDDTNAIQAALDAMHYYWYSELHFPHGNYQTTRPLNLKACKIIRGESPHSCIVSGIHSGDILHTKEFDQDTWWKLTDNGLYNYINYYNHGVRIQDIQFRGLDSSTGAGLSIYLPGEGCYVENVGLNRNMVGLRVVGGGAPGIRARNVSAHACSDSAVRLEGAWYNSGYRSLQAVAMDLDTISSDINTTTPFLVSGGSVIKVVNGNPTLFVRNLKVEGQHGSGIVHWIQSTGREASEPIGSINIVGGHVNGNNVFNDVTVPLVMISSGAGRHSNRSPNVSINNVGLNAIEYLIEDRNLLNASGEPFRYPVESVGGLAQAEARTPIYYSAVRTTETGPVRREIRQDGKCLYKFQPFETGWYRIALNGLNPNLGGSFGISTSTHSGDFVNFDCYTDNQESHIKIRNSSRRSLNKVSAIRCGYAPGVNYCIDLAITGIFGVNDLFSSNHLEITSDTRGIRNSRLDHNILTDPYLVSASFGQFSNYALAELTNPATNDLGYYLNTSDSGNILSIIESTGTALQNQIDSIEVGGGSTTNGVTGIYISGGSAISGNIGISGKNNVYVFQDGNTISISGDTSAFLSTETLEATGSALQNQFNSLSGYLTGNLITLTGKGNVSVITGESEITISGDLSSVNTTIEATGTSLQDQLDVISTFSKSITIESPQPGDSVTLFQTHAAITLTKVTSLVRGEGLASGQYSIRFGSDREAAGTEVLTNNFSVTGRGTGDSFPSLSNTAVSSNDWIWLNVVATGETLSGLHSTLFYTYS